MISDKLREIIEFRKVELWGLLIGVLLVGAGIFWLKTAGESETKIEVVKAAVTEVSETSSPSGELIAVDVAGAVKKSGVYKVAKDTRVGEVLDQAGGLAPGADTGWVEKYINRSEKVRDGMKIYIPKKGEQETVKAEVVNNVSGDTPVNSKVDINKAGQAELEALPGIGPVTAGKIISGRPYARIEELSEKKIVNSRVWEQIRERVVAW